MLEVLCGGCGAVTRLWRLCGSNGLPTALAERVLEGGNGAVDAAELPVWPACNAHTPADALEQCGAHAQLVCHLRHRQMVVRAQLLARDGRLLLSHGVQSGNGKRPKENKQTKKKKPREQKKNSCAPHHTQPEDAPHTARAAQHPHTRSQKEVQERFTWRG